MAYDNVSKKERSELKKQYIAGGAALQSLKNKDKYGAACVYLNSFGDYLRDANGELYGLAALTLHEFLHSKEPSKTSIGIRMSIGANNLEGWLDNSTLEDILASEFGNGLDSEVANAMKAQHGSTNYGEIRKKFEEYQAMAESIEAKYKAMEARADDEEKKKELEQEKQKELIELTKKYDAEKLSNFLDDISRLQNALYAQKTRDAVLHTKYILKLTPEQIAKKAFE